MQEDALVQMNKLKVINEDATFFSHMIFENFLCIQI